MISDQTKNCKSKTATTKSFPEKSDTAPSMLNRIRANFGLLTGSMTRKGVVSLADQIVASANNFLTGIIIGRACTKEEFGLYMLGFSVVFFVIELQNSLISTPYMIYSPHLKYSAHAKYTGSTLIHQLALSAITILTLTAGGVVLLIYDSNQGLTTVLWVLVMVITFIMLRDFVRRICFTWLRMKTALLFDSCVIVVQISSLLILAHLGLLSANLAFWVIGIASGISVLGWFILKRNAFTIRINQVISDFGQNWSTGKWVFASSLLWSLCINVYPWILVFFHGTASAGVWAACFGTAAILFPLFFGVQNLIGPKTVYSYVEGGAMALRRFVFKASAVFTLIIAPFSIILIVFGGQLVVLFYGDKYAGNDLVVSMLAVNHLVVATVFTLSRALFAIERADVHFAANFAALFVLLSFGILLVKSLGPLGVACGILAGNTAVAVLLMMLFVRLIRRVCMQEIDNE